MSENLKSQLEKHLKIFRFVIIIFLLIMTTSTIYEIITLKQKRDCDELLSSFSIIRNGRKLFHIETGDGKFYSCLSGLRTFAMFHILFGHFASYSSKHVPMINLQTVKVDGDWSKSFVGAFWAVHPMAVDTFFVMTGMLLTRSLLIQIEKGRLNIPKLYLHRYLRITPVLAFLILISLSIMKYFGETPLYSQVYHNIFKRRCEKNWWAALLHIQNYYDPLNYVSHMKISLNLF